MNTHSLQPTQLNQGKYRARTPSAEGYACEKCRQTFKPPTKTGSKWKGEQERKSCPALPA